MSCPCKLKSGQRKGQPCGAKVRVGTRFCSKHQACAAVPARAQQARAPSARKPIFLNLYYTLFPDADDIDIIEELRENSDDSVDDLLKKIAQVRNSRWTTFYLPRYLDDIKYQRAEKYVKRKKIPIGSILYLGTSGDRELYGFAQVMPDGTVRGMETDFFYHAESPDEIKTEYPDMAEDIIKFYNDEGWFD